MDGIVELSVPSTTVSLHCQSYMKRETETIMLSNYLKAITTQCYNNNKLLLTTCQVLVYMSYI